ncbi:MAG TPA: type II secretion system protein [Candidatus Paceibacterota bacterium]
MRKDRGFTLVELLISSGLFIVLVGLAAGVFIQTLRTQRIIINLSASMNDAAFVIEGMAREIRTGSSFNDTTGEVEVLQFTNDDGEEVNYKLVTYSVGGGSVNGVGRCVGDCPNDNDYEIMTSPEVGLDRLNFILMGTEAGDNFPPRVSIILTVIGEKGITINLQTTVSARILDT